MPGEILQSTPVIATLVTTAASFHPSEQASLSKLLPLLLFTWAGSRHLRVLHMQRYSWGEETESVFSCTSHRLNCHDWPGISNVWEHLNGQWGLPQMRGVWLQQLWNLAAFTHWSWVRVWAAITGPIVDSETYLEISEDLLGCRGLAMAHQGGKDTDSRNSKGLLCFVVDGGLILVVVQSLSHVLLFVTSWTAAH